MKKRSVITIAALTAMSFQVLAATPFSMTSRDISGDRRLAPQQVFEGFGCHGGNQSPQLAWKTRPPVRKVLPLRSMTRMRLPAAAGGTGQ